MTTFPLARQADPRKWWLFAALVALAAVPIGVTTGVFGREPWVAACIIAALTGIMLVGLVVCDRSRQVRFEIGGGVLRVRGEFFFGTEIPVISLRLDGAEIVDLTVRRELRPGWKTCGTGLPGYWSGHFQLKNGREALVFLSDLRQVLVLPEKSDRLILLSCDDPAAVLRALAA